MPIIRSSADIRNKYLEISDLCHQTNEAIFITKNGKGDLAVMSIQAYDMLMDRLNLYAKIGEGLDDIKQGRVSSFDTFAKKFCDDRKINSSEKFSSDT